MVSATVNEGKTSTLILRPKQSLSWRETELVYGGILAFLLVVAIAFAILGFWPVLPFAGAELLLLGGALYLSQRRGNFGARQGSGGRERPARVRATLGFRPSMGSPSTTAIKDRWASKPIDLRFARQTSIGGIFLN